MAKKIKYICSKCGNDNVRRDAFAVWDIRKQEWVHDTVLDCAHCFVCDGECRLEKVELDVEVDPKWDDNHIQFPRLLGEIMAEGLCDSKVLAVLAEAMDLQPSQVNELFERGQAEWDRIKAQ